MLTELSIKKFAIIDDLTISFTDGLTVLTGETGAGKSIIINAVNLMLGSRVSSKLIRTGAETAEIEALFEITPDSKVARKMDENGYDSSNGLLIKRIISANGRHKIFINGSLATIQILSSITDSLASISGQHAHQGLLNEELHLDYLDQFGGLFPLRAEVGLLYKKFIPLKNKLNRLVNSLKRDAEQLELYEFQKKEIEDADIGKNEDMHLEDEKKRLEHSEYLLNLSQKGLNDLYEGEGSISDRLNSLARDLEKGAMIDNSLDPVTSELTDVIYRLEDIAAQFREYGSGITIDDGRLEDVNERLDFLTKLKRKYGGRSGDLDNIFKTYNSICKKLDSVVSADDQIAALKEEAENVFKALSSKALKLSSERKKVAGKFAKRVEHELASLEMKDTKFKVELSNIPKNNAEDKMLVISEIGAISETGCDKAEFLIAPNVGEELKPMTKIASGGELSRVVLALKAILVSGEDLGTIVFDEVDTGVGGSIAEVVGRKIAQLSHFHQVICITHLPQIAKFGNQHYKIEKRVVAKRTETTISKLKEEDRVVEIARMLGGVEITNATMEHAREMITLT